MKIESAIRRLESLLSSPGTTSETASIIEGLCKSDEESLAPLFEKSRQLTEKTYGKKIFMRGLIEFSNHCGNDCYYCGIRRSNKELERYRLTTEEILDCCRHGYQLGFRTFVLQSGEDKYFGAEKIAALVGQIKSSCPDCAVTLSLGERPFSDYKLFRAAGADRYLLRHESACPNHYRRLKPPELDFENRRRCLFELKELGYQVGAGFMTGSPFQTYESLALDLEFLRELEPQMVGIGPFIPHHQTPFRNHPPGSVRLTLIMLALTRLLLPHALIPATTALGTADPRGREKGILAGANVVMPNLSPKNVRRQYQLYDNKICTGSEAAECLECLRRRLSAIDRKLVVDRGDFRSDQPEPSV